MHLPGRTLRRTLLVATAALAGLATAAAAISLLRHRSAVARAEAEWQEDVPAALGDFGTTRRLEVLPLVDWHTGPAGVLGDMGVSYLVRTDTLTVLFDTGGNAAELSPSPLEHNMQRLGVRLSDVDAVFLSHAHFDHVGGRRWTHGALSGTTFGIGNAQPPLPGKRLYVPVPMTYPGARPEVTRAPGRLAPGVATTGTIPRALFLGRVDEQALAIHVEGKGLVLIVGCGHQTVRRLLERVERVSDAPVYGVIGGLHFPVPDGRVRVVGLNAQRWLASGTGPLGALSPEGVQEELSLLERRGLGVLAIGGHDSSDAVISEAAARFPGAYRYLRVGEPIVIE